MLMKNNEKLFTFIDPANDDDEFLDYLLRLARAKAGGTSSTTSLASVLPDLMRRAGQIIPGKLGKRAADALAEQS